MVKKQSYQLADYKGLCIEKTIPMAYGLQSVATYRELAGEGVPLLLRYEIVDKRIKLVLSYTEGTTLDVFCESEDWLLWMDIVVKNAFLTLHQIHKRGYLHRDIKPENIIVGRDLRITFIDFDHAVKRPINRSLDVVGTVEFMAPEVINSASTVDERSDYYALASSFFKYMKPHLRIVPENLLKSLLQMKHYNQDERPTDVLNWVRKI